MAASGFVELLEKLDKVENENLRLRAKLSRADVADDVTAPNENEDQNKKQPRDENVSDEELDRRAKEVACEIERRRRAKQKESPVSDMEDTSSSPSEDTEEAAYWSAVREMSSFVSRVHMRANGRSAAPSESEVSYDKAMQAASFAAANDVPYETRVKAMSNFITACDRRRRGLI